MAIYEGQFVNAAGRVYHVDKDKGSASGTGLSYATAMNEIGLASTAANTWRALQDNIYLRPTILVYGCSQAYASIAADLTNVDIIGIGANVMGNGGTGTATGIPTIGDNSATCAADGYAGSLRSVTLQNLQFVSDGAYWPGDFYKIFRSSIINCAFYSGPNGSAGNFRTTNACGGNLIKGCHMVTDNPNVPFGMHISGGLQWNNSRVEDCTISGVTAAVYIAATTDDRGTVWTKNHIGEFTDHEPDLCALGVDDDGRGMARWDGNWVSATDAFSSAAGTDRLVGNHVVNTSTGAMEASGS